MVATPVMPCITMGRGAAIRAGTFQHSATEPVSGWHRHDFDEIEYAVEGVAEIVTEDAHYLLPPQHAAWIPAGVAHSPFLRDVTTVAVFFDPSVFELPHRQAAIFPVGALLREMIVYASRWPIDRRDDDEEAHAFFVALADVLRHQLAHPAPLSLPVSTDPVVADVMAYTTTHLATVTAARVCRDVGISERTLRRRFPAAVGQTWREYLQQARLFRAMAMLSTTTSSVRDVALTVGFESPSAFARAFQAWTGENPSAYRSRVLADHSVGRT